MTSPNPLQQLAESCGITTAYTDAFDRRVIASPESLMATLRLLDVPIRRPAEAEALIERQRRAVWQRVCEPVTVAWDRAAATIELRLPSAAASSRLRCMIERESGERETWDVGASRLKRLETATIGRQRFVRVRLSLPPESAHGYSRLTIHAPRLNAETFLIRAPRHAYAPKRSAKHWGSFLPLYAARSERNWGVGDWTDLEALIRWTSTRGGRVVGTVPMLAAFLEQPYDPSPYAPVSRLFWNELYVDLSRAPEFEPALQRMTPATREAIERQRQALAASPSVEYRRVYALKRRVLEAMAQTLFAGGDQSRRDACERFRRDEPDVEEYARFRAAVEQRRKSWRDWPADLQRKSLAAQKVNDAAVRYHVYAQWLCREQLERVAAEADASDTALYVDLPLGAHAGGYDTWRRRELFLLNASAGAPPDRAFLTGQDWGFPPLHPQRIREDRYQYMIAGIREQMRYANALRIDHVMGLHRLFVIPRGRQARDGVYVRYPAEELYAILLLESQRHRCRLVGEDLGTVPPETTRALTRHRIRGMAVLQYALQPNASRPLGRLAPQTVASLNTHDMPTFAAFWEERDLAQLRQLKRLSEAQCREASAFRRQLKAALLAYAKQRRLLRSARPTTQQVFELCVRLLARSDAEWLLIGLDDLWGERLPHNIPGTWREYPNWQRKAKPTLEQAAQQPSIERLLQRVREDRERR